MEKGVVTKDVLLNMERDLKNILEVQLMIIHNLEINYNFLTHLTKNIEKINDHNSFLFLKKLVSNDVVVNFSILFDKKGKFSFLKLYNLTHKSSLTFELCCSNPSSNLLSKLYESIKFYEGNIKSIRDKHVSHIDISNESIKLPYDDILKQINLSKEVHKEFCGLLKLDYSTIQFHEKQLNNFIDDNIIVKKIEDEELKKILK